MSSSPSSATAEVGMVGFARTNDFIGKAIRFGEWLRFRKGDTWNHAFIVDSIKDGIPYVLQADVRGVTNDKPLSSVGEYILLNPKVVADLDKLRYFARKQLRDGYGWATIFFLVVDIITPKWFPAFHPSSKGRPSWICSTLTGEALRFAGWYHDWADPMLVTPAQLYEALTSEFSAEFEEVDAPG